MNNDPFDKLCVTRYLHEAFLSLNLGFSIAYSLLTYLVAPLSPGTALESRIITRANALLKLQARSAVGLEVAFVASMFAVALTFFVLLLFLRFVPVALNRLILQTAGGILALAAAQAFWVYALRAGGRYIFWWDDYPTWPARWPWLSMGVEVSLILALVYGIRKRRMTFWYSAVLLFAHYSYWTWCMWPGMSHAFRFSAPKFCFLATPLSGLAWLLYLSAQRKHAPAMKM